MKRPVLKGKRIDLIIPTMKHAANIQKHINHKDIARWMPTVPYPYKLSDAEYYIKQMALKDLRNNSGYLFSIYHKEDGEIIGGMGLHLKENNNAVIGYWLGKKYWRQGIASEGLRIILNFAFKKLKVHKVSANVFEGNEKSEGILKKFSFVKEAVLREHVVVGRKRLNEIIFGLLREEYDKKN